MLSKLSNELTNARHNHLALLLKDSLRFAPPDVAANSEVDNAGADDDVGNASTARTVTYSEDGYLRQYKWEL